MNEDLWQKRLALFALPIIVLAFYITASSHFRYTPDDTYIYLQFAKNVIHGNGVSFNPGEPTYGITSPLWLFIISLGGALGVDVCIAAKAIDLFFASMAIIAFYFLAYEIIRDIVIALLATIAFSVNAWLLRWAGSGMETSLSVLLVLLTVWFCLRNDYLLSAAMAALLTLVRPESFILWGLIITDIYINSVNKRLALKKILTLSIFYIVLLLPWLAYARLKFGSFVPNTAMGKAGLNFTINDTTSTFFDLARTLSAADGIALFILVITGSILFVTRKKLTSEIVHEQEQGFFVFRQSFVGLSWAFILSLFYILTDVNVVSRYLLIVSPFVIIYAYFFLATICTIFPLRRFVYAIAVVCSALIMLQNQFFYKKYVLPGIDAFEEGMETCLIPIGTWLKQNSPPNSVIVVGDIGAIGYYSERTMCDAAGLITPSMLSFMHQGCQPYEIIEKKLYKQSCSPDYVIHRSVTQEALKNDPELVPLFIKPFFHMSLDDTRVIYYTVYAVKNKSSITPTAQKTL